jgi:hypothetical protein
MIFFGVLMYISISIAKMITDSYKDILEFLYSEEDC